MIFLLIMRSGNYTREGATQELNPRKRINKFKKKLVMKTEKNGKELKEKSKKLRVRWPRLEPDYTT